MSADRKSQDAIARLEQIPEEDHTAQSYHELGNLYRAQDRAEDAVLAYQSAIELDPQFAPAYAAAGEVFMENGMAMEAMNCLGSALLLDNTKRKTKENFLALARSARFTLFNPQIKHLLLECLRTDTLDVSFMGPTLYSLLQQDPELKDILASLENETWEAAHATFFALGNHSALFDPFFILTLQRQIVIPKPAYERALIHLRRLLLEQARGAGTFCTDEELRLIAGALANYCYYSEYIMPVSDAEQKALASLRDKAAAGDETAFALYGCYEPLHQIADTQQAADMKSAHLAPLIKLQIENYYLQKELQAQVTPLTPIEDDVSAKVRQQYEESPYPAWRDFKHGLHHEEIEGRLRDIDHPRILSAGCGTGREPIELAYALPDADVTAVDLSTASIAYGMRKAKEAGIKNITFRQADILKLGEAGLAPFDYIASTGVIHHMEDPIKGWDILTGLLKPGGLMRLCLYSKTARESLYAARDVIAAKGYAATPEDIRRFRVDAPDILSPKDYEFVSGMFDYYQLSECRDLLFHVQEYAFTLEEIDAYLQKNSLRFLGFYISGDTLQKYAIEHPSDPQGVDLKRWMKFEKKHPHTFTGMYRMWLEKE